MRTKSSPTNAVWDRYARLNHAVVEEFFGDDAADRLVYLDLEPDSQARIVKRMGENTATQADELILEVVRETLPAADGPGGLFGGHAALTSRWDRDGSSVPPPCIGMLAVLSLVAERMKQTERFAGSNYYGRLLQALHIGAEFHDRVGRDFRRYTPLLWNALNRWLEDSGGRRGLPTAVAFDRRRFIGLPLSQALVRSQDRLKLPAMFAQFGLQPGQRISVMAMQELLAEWIPNSQITPSLKILWSSQFSKQRISEVVCAELEGWDGVVPEELKPAGQKLDNLFLAAELMVHPRPAMELLLLARRDGQSGFRSRPAVLSADASGAAISALGRLGDKMSLQPLPGTPWEAVEPSDLISYAELLVANVSLELCADGSACTRRARRLVLLKRLEADHLYVEVRRAELLETYVVLAISELAVHVREVLDSGARKGWRELSHKTLAGLPPTWTAFQDVQLERITSVSIEDLAPLQPIARTHLALGGGLPLAGINVWHRDRLPELRVVVDEDGEKDLVDVRGVPTRYLDGRKEAIVRIAQLEGAGVVELSQIPKLQEGDFRIVVASPRKDRTLATASLRIRSGSWPRRLQDGEDTLIGHALLDGGSFAPFGAALPDSSNATRIVGALVENAPETVRRDGEMCQPLPGRPGVIVEDVEEQGWDLAEPAEESAAEELPVCFTRAYHHWLLEAGEGKNPVYSICRDCGREKWWDPPRRRRRSKGSVPTAGTRDGVASGRAHKALPKIREGGRADMELVLDALSYTRSGPWRSLRAITTHIDDAPWFAHEASRRLEALGHIQLEVDPRSLAPKRWCIAPPTVVEPESGPCFLAGSRSARLVQVVEEVVSEQLGGDVYVVSQPDGPDVVEIHGLDSDELALLVDEISEHRGQDLRLSICPASRLATMLPSLTVIRVLLPELTMSARQFDRFDLDSGRWVPADQMNRAGAYRLRSRPLIYAVVPPVRANGLSSVVADVRLAKHLAASDASFALIGYDEPSAKLLASAGAPLPGLFERAAVLCSGRLPTRREDGSLAYERVPVEVAESIWQAWKVVN